MCYLSLSVHGGYEGLDWRGARVRGHLCAPHQHGPHQAHLYQGKHGGFIVLIQMCMLCNALNTCTPASTVKVMSLAFLEFEHV